MTITYTKQCKCDAKVSGPRFVMSSWKLSGDKATATVTMAMMACDKCDKPCKVRIVK